MVQSGDFAKQLWVTKILISKHQKSCNHFACLASSLTPLSLSLIIWSGIFLARFIEIDDLYG